MSATSEPLTINAFDGTGSITLTPQPEISAVTYAISAFLHGRTVTNDSVHVLGIAGFLSALDDFERTREGSAVLNGTYDFRLEIAPDGFTGSAWLSFQLHEYIALPHPPGGPFMRLSLEGSFGIPGEMLATLVRDFHVLFAACGT